jgi:hypothetical protein
VDLLAAALTAKTPGAPLIAALTALDAANAALPSTTQVGIDITKLEITAITFPSISITHFKLGTTCSC